MDAVILKCANCGTEFMCSEKQVKEIEKDGCLCGKKMDFDVVPEEQWTKEDVEFARHTFGQLPL